MRIIVVILLSFLSACSNEYDNMAADGSTISISTSDVFTDKGLYEKGESVHLSLLLSNLENSDQAIRRVGIKIILLDKKDAPVEHEYTLVADLNLTKGSTKDIRQQPVWLIPSDAAAGAYGIYLEVLNEKNEIYTEYKTFFRVGGSSALTTFDIKTSKHGALDVFSLDGGMSAEYAIEKAAESISAGISHSWNVHRTGMGPNPVLSTPEFLEKSVTETVAFYDEVFGKHQTFETVIIGAGIPSAPYLSSTMNAPFLPLHFLVGVNTVREVKTILDYSNRNGISSYATVGYDASVPTGVAWVKLLDIPEQYLEFLKNHQVKQVILFGYEGALDGENTARMVDYDKGTGKYAPGSLYVLHVQGGNASDEEFLRNKLLDIGNLTLGGFEKIADWESGINQKQIDNFSARIKSQTSISSIHLLTSQNDIPLWDLGSYLALSYARKNNSLMKVEGITINPYLIGHPFHESRAGLIPLLFWQGNPAASTANRLMSVTRDAFAYYFPEMPFNSMKITLNFSNNFGGAANAASLKTELTKHDFKEILSSQLLYDEVWRPEDGMNAPCEQRAVYLEGQAAHENLKDWRAKLQPLSIDDLTEIQRQFSNIIFSKL